MLTTHLLEEAEKADRIAILNEGSLVALDTPDALRATVGGDSITIQTADPQSLAAAITAALRLSGERARRGRAAGTAEWPRVDRPAGRGISRPDRSDHARQADAGRRVHRSHRASLLARARGGGRWLKRLLETRKSNRRRAVCADRAGPSAAVAGRLDAVPARVGAVHPPAESRVRRDRAADDLLAAVRRGLGPSFDAGDAAGRLTYREYFFPGTLVLILLFTAIFATISIIEDRREGFLQSVLVAPIPRWSMVLGKIARRHADRRGPGLLFLLLGYTLGLLGSGRWRWRRLSAGCFWCRWR